MDDETKKSQPRHRLRNIKITTLALCARGKNQMRTLYKADGPDKGVTFQPLVKGMDEQGEVLSVVYAPDRPDYDGDMASAEEIKKACHEYNRDHRQVDIEHDGKILDKSEAYIAENFIVGPGDARFADWTDYDGNPVGDLTGAWATVTKIEAPELRKAFREGAFNGISMFGTAEAEPAVFKSAEERVFDRVVKATGSQPTENEVNPEELKALLKAMKEEILAEVKPQETPIEPAADDSADDLQAPVFDGDMSLEGLERFKKAMEAYELQKSLRAGTLKPEDLERMIAKAREVEPSDAEAGIEAEDTEEVRELKRKLHKAQKSSNVSPVQKSQGADEFGFDLSDEGILTISKAQADFASEVAAIANRAKGLSA